MNKKAYLVLETGDVFEGVSFGAEGNALGELVFTTSVVGYIEALTDPSYYGQILLFTFPQMGNYGMISADMESAVCHAKGVVMREVCPTPSNFRCEGTLEDFLIKNNIPGIGGVDTRYLTQLVRDHGVMNAVITDKKPEGTVDGLKEYKIVGSVAAVCGTEKKAVPAHGEEKCSAVVIDYGCSKNIIAELTQRGCRVDVLPYNATAGEVLALDPDGIVLSDGPGDPADNPLCIEQLAALMGKKPLLGIGLGHQLLALAAGGKTEKLKYGHRGSNQPVCEISSGKVYITAQNHGYTVTTDGLDSAGAVVTYKNANDGTCEGLHYPEKQAFSFQFHPETHTGAREMEYSFDKFIRLIGGDR